MLRKTITGVVQGIILGTVLAFITANMLLNAEAKAMRVTDNGWTITFLPGSAQTGNDNVCAYVYILEVGPYW